MGLVKFDEFDAGIKSERQKARYGLREIAVGDIVINEEGLRARVAHVWDDSIQTTSFNKEGTGGSFHLYSSGNMSHSGSLESGIDRRLFMDTHTKEKGACWFFHHGESGAHRDVQTEIYVRVWKIVSKSEAPDKEKEGNCIYDGETGRLQTTTYFTLDGQERVQYTDRETIESYLENHPKFKKCDWEAFQKIEKTRLEKQCTNPEEITEERYWDMLEVLPPCRFKNGRFHVSERITGNLVSWFFKKNGKHFSFTHFDDLTEEKLHEIITKTPA